MDFVPRNVDFQNWDQGTFHRRHDTPIKKGSNKYVARSFHQIASQIGRNGVHLASNALKNEFVMELNTLVEKEELIGEEAKSIIKVSYQFSYFPDSIE